MFSLTLERRHIEFVRFSTNHVSAFCHLIVGAVLFVVYLPFDLQPNFRDLCLDREYYFIPVIGMVVVCIFIAYSALVSVSTYRNMLILTKVICFCGGDAICWISRHLALARPITCID